MTNNNDNRRKEHWHMSKGFSVGTAASVAILLLTQVYTFGKNAEKLITVEKQVVEAAKDKIHKSTVVQMFKNKDIQIQAVKKDIERLQVQTDHIEAKIDRSQELLLEIIRAMKDKDS